MLHFHTKGFCELLPGRFVETARQDNVVLDKELTKVGAVVSRQALTMQDLHLSRLDRSTSWRRQLDGMTVETSYCRLETEKCLSHSISH